MKSVVFLEDQNPNEESALLKDLRKHVRPQLMRVERFQSVTEAQKLVEKPHLIIMHWSCLKNPVSQFNAFLRDAELVKVPVIAVGKNLTIADQNLLLESSCGPALVDTGNPVQTAKILFQAINQVFDDRLLANRKNARYREMFSLLNMDDHAKLLQVFKEREQLLADVIDRGVFLALVLCKVNKHKEAIIQATNTLAAIPPEHVLRVHLLDVLGECYLKSNDLEAAEKFLLEACEYSSNGLKRRFLMGQCYVEMEVPQKALPHYTAVYRIEPGYDGIHTRLAEIFYACSRGSEDLEQIKPLFPRFSDRELVNFYKRILGYIDVRHSQTLMDMIVREFSLRANQFIDANDFYAALKPYKHIEKIIDADDAERQQLLSYCYSRVYYRADEPELALQHIDRALGLTETPKDKHLQLKKLIEKKLAGVKKSA